MELKLDLDDVDYVLGTMKLLGSKGTTGTQASFLELFDGDHEKCRRADQMIAEKMGFDGCFPVSGQTYSRKIDSRVLSVLAGIAQSTHKFSNDIRLLQHLKEVEEPFEGADKIFFQPAAGHCLLLTNKSDCTLMQNREILMKGHSYQISLNSKVDITFEDERSEIALQYRDVKPSDMRLLAGEPH